MLSRRLPYPGAKPSFLIGDEIEDAEWLSQLHCADRRRAPQAEAQEEKKKKKTKKNKKTKRQRKMSR